jgi:hypothetical protein
MLIMLYAPVRSFQAAKATIHRPVIGMQPCDGLDVFQPLRQLLCIGLLTLALRLAMR